MRYKELDAKGAKKALNQLFYFGKVVVDLPFLWGLVHDIRLAAEVLLRSPEFSYLRTMFTERPNPQATRLFYAIAKLQRQHVDQICSWKNNAIMKYRRVDVMYTTSFIRRSRIWSGSGRVTHFYNIVFSVKGSQ